SAAFFPQNLLKKADNRPDDIPLPFARHPDVGSAPETSGPPFPPASSRQEAAAAHLFHRLAPAAPAQAHLAPSARCLPARCLPARCLPARCLPRCCLHGQHAGQAQPTLPRRKAPAWPQPVPIFSFCPAVAVSCPP